MSLGTCEGVGGLWVDAVKPAAPETRNISRSGWDGEPKSFFLCVPSFSQQRPWSGAPAPLQVQGTRTGAAEAELREPGELIIQCARVAFPQVSGAVTPNSTRGTACIH